MYWITGHIHIYLFISVWTLGFRFLSANRSFKPYIEMNEEPSDVQPASVLDVSLDNVVNILKNHEEEIQTLTQKKLSLDLEIESLKGIVQQLEVEKSEIDADITTLRLRNIAYQKEHTNLRNTITVAKYQIEKIKESISKAKENHLKDLEDFEKAVDEITEKFRSGPTIYDRRILLEKIEKEKEKQELLIKKLHELRNSYENFNRENGLRERRDESEEFRSCILPGSRLGCFVEMTKTLDEVISGIKKLCKGVKQENLGDETHNTK